jgi:hypothetical protein
MHAVFLFLNRKIPNFLRARGIEKLEGAGMLVRLFKTAALACSRSGRRRTDFVVVRFLRE